MSSETGSIKKKFTHFTAIPFYLKAESIELNEANAWQNFYHEGRALGFNSKGYPWALFRVKYVKGTDSKWRYRILGEIISSDSRQKLIEAVILAIRDNRNKNYKNYTALLDETIEDLLKFRDGICEVELQIADIVYRPTRRKEVEKRLEKEAKLEAEKLGEEYIPKSKEVDKTEGKKLSIIDKIEGKKEE